MMKDEVNIGGASKQDQLVQGRYALYPRLIWFCGDGWLVLGGCYSVVSRLRSVGFGAVCCLCLIRDVDCTDWVMLLADG